MEQVNEKRIANAIEKMILFYDGSLHDIEHFLKVWAYAKTIGYKEGLDQYTQETLELASIAHDIACPLCREKYGNTNGKYQEEEGIPLTEDFYRDMNLSQEQLHRICYLVGHHHTYHEIDGVDYQILLEADFLVNAGESHYSKEQITTFRSSIFKTTTGIALLNTLYGLE